MARRFLIDRKDDHMARRFLIDRKDLPYDAFVPDPSWLGPIDTEEGGAEDGDPRKKAPSCPKWLEPEAKKEWRRLAKKMELMGVLTEVDMAAFAGYCQAYARWKEAEEFITQHGTIVKTPSGYWQQVPQVSIAQTYLKVMNRFAEQFGLTPASRSRIVADTTSSLHPVPVSLRTPPAAAARMSSKRCWEVMRDGKSTTCQLSETGKL